MDYTPEQMAQAIKHIHPDGEFVGSGYDFVMITDHDLPTDEEIKAALADIEKLAYRDERALAYASIADQLDMQYHDSVNGTTTWRDHIADVKARFPKPE